MPAPLRRRWRPPYNHAASEHSASGSSPAGSSAMRIQEDGRTRLRDFARIYQEYQPKIHRYLRNLIGEDGARDLTQVVFLKVSRGLDGFREESSLSTWIYRIATNTARDHAVSSLAKQRSAEQLFEDADSMDDLPDTGLPGTDQAYIRREMNDSIRGVVNQGVEGPV